MAISRAAALVLSSIISSATTGAGAGVSAAQTGRLQGEAAALNQAEIAEKKRQNRFNEMLMLEYRGRKKEVENLDIHKIINSKQRRDIRLDEPVSIFIRYYTCTADSEGNIYYHPDIYSRDRKEIQEIIAISENS